MTRRLHILLVAILTMGPMAQSVVEGQTLSTTGLENLTSFFIKAENSTNPVTVVSFGDSMADSYQSISFVLMNQLQSVLGYAGYSLNNYQDAAMCRFTNGAYIVNQPSAFWFNPSFRVPPGGGLWWDAVAGPSEHSTTGGGVRCDRVGLFYVTQPAGGILSLQISTNGGPWKPLFLLNGYSAAPAGVFTNIDVPPDYYRLRVNGLTGTNVIIGTQTLLTRSSGLHAVFTDLGGISLADVTNVPLSIRIPIFRALAPDLIVWHMKEDGSEATRARLQENEQWWSNAVPHSAVLYIGTPYVSLDSSSTTAITVAQNTVVRQTAQKWSRAYMDCMTPSVSFAWMAANGFMKDGTHENLFGNQYLESSLWRDTGFFSLRMDRQISLSHLDSKVRLEWPTASGVAYQLEASTDLKSWSTIYGVVGDGGTKSWTNQSPDQALSYRLKLTAF